MNCRPVLAFIVGEFQPQTKQKHQCQEMNDVAWKTYSLSFIQYTRDKIFAVWEMEWVPHLSQLGKSRSSMAPSHIKAVFLGMGIPMLKITRSRNRVIFNMGIPILYWNGPPGRPFQSTYHSAFLQSTMIIMLCFAQTKYVYSHTR